MSEKLRMQKTERCPKCGKAYMVRRGRTDEGIVLTCPKCAARLVSFYARPVNSVLPPSPKRKGGK